MVDPKAPAAPPVIRVRSPNYPGIGLSEAVQRVRLVYQKQHTHPASREVIAKVLGYNGLNGASAGVVSALVKYGLMEHTGDNIRISRDGIDVVLHRKGDPEYSAAIQRCGLLPVLFRELHDQYGDTLPTDHALRAYLQKRDFNPRVVDTVIRVYRETLEFVSAETNGDATDAAEVMGDNSGLGESGPDFRSHAASMQASVGGSGGGAGNDNVNERVTAFQLSSECHARIVFSGHVTQDDIDLLVELLRINRRAYPMAEPPEQHEASPKAGPA